MAPELAAKFPEIKTYFGQGIDDPTGTVRFDITPAGFHAQILSPNGAVYVDPYWKDDAILHTSYYKRDYSREVNFECLTTAQSAAAARPSAADGQMRSGNMLRTYRLACAATGEYTQFHGGTVLAGMSAIVTAVNRITGVFETELAIRLVLVANNDLIVYTSPGNDPYSNNNASLLLSQNQSNLDSVIGSANYDIGHVFGTGDGGLADVGVVCVAGSKARGKTGSASPTGDSFYVDYVVHEIGHQFGANHTFNGVSGNCGGSTRNAATAYEPGSGSTIMAYAGLCGTDNLQPHSDPYFHSASFDEILNYITAGSGSGCPTQTPTSNNAPMVEAGPDFVIPKNTPFTLTASGSDPDGDPLTFCWEERDLGPPTAVNSPDDGSGPLFRSLNPVFIPTRTFPKLSDILGNTITIGEQLPTTGRIMNFRVTARDQRAGGGGVNTDDMQITVAATAGPFMITSPNTAGNWSGLQTVTWNAAGTASAPVNTASVNILLSTNSGNSFPITLAANTPNDGSELVMLPNISNATARIKVEAVGNIFFDISATNITITPSVVFVGASVATENCAPANGAVDPGETVTVNLVLKNVGSTGLTNLIVTLLASNGVTFPSGSQTYGSLAAGGTSANIPFTFTAAGNCGDAIIARFHLQNGDFDLGEVNTTFYLGGMTSTTTSLDAPALIRIPATGSSGPGSPYPSTITVAGLGGNVTKVTVTLLNLTNSFPDDIDILLVGPTGQTLVLMSDAGGGTDIGSVTLTFDDTAGGPLPDAGQITTGNFNPTDYGAGDTFPAPAPAGPYGTTLSAFNGINPNGIWALYVVDDTAGDVGSINDGWRLSLTIQLDPACCDSANVRPIIQSITLSGQTVTLVWSAVAGKTYRVQYKPDLETGDWIDLAGDVPATAATATKEAVIGPGLHRFYRVVVLP